MNSTDPEPGERFASADPLGGLLALVTALPPPLVLIVDDRAPATECVKLEGAKAWDLGGCFW